MLPMIKFILIIKYYVQLYHMERSKPTIRCFIQANSSNTNLAYSIQHNIITADTLTSDQMMFCEVP